MAMSQWESMLDLYTGDLVNEKKAHKPSTPTNNSPAPPPPPPMKSPSPKKSDFKKMIGKDGLRGLGGSGFDLGHNNADGENDDNNYNNNIHQNPPTTSNSLLESDYYKNEDLAVVSSTFIDRISKKLRLLAQTKRTFQDIVNFAVQEQATKWQELSGNVSGAIDFVNKSIIGVDKINHTFVSNEMRRKDKDLELKSGIATSVKLMEEETQEHNRLLKSQTELRIKFQDESKKLGDELEDLKDKFASANKGLAAGKKAVEEALVRLEKNISEKNQLMVENDDLVRRNLDLGGDRARLLDICERLRFQVGQRDGHLSKYAGDITSGIDLNSYNTNTNFANSTGYQQQQQHQHQHQQQHGVTVSDKIVARELEATRELFEKAGNGEYENFNFSPTLLNTTPLPQQPRSGYRSTSQHMSTPHHSFMSTTNQQQGSTFKQNMNPASFITPPPEEQQRRNAVKKDLDKSMSQLNQIVEKIEAIVSTSTSFVENFSKVKGETNGSARVTELENELYQLLDSNARIALQLQQLGMDLRRVYKRFKNLEGDGGKKTKEKNTTSNLNSRGASDDGLEGGPGGDDIQNLGDDLQKGAEYLEGDEREKAFKLLKELNVQRGGGGGGGGTKKKLLQNVGSELDAIAQRLDSI